MPPYYQMDLPVFPTISGSKDVFSVLEKRGAGKTAPDLALLILHASWLRSFETAYAAAEGVEC